MKLVHITTLALCLCATTASFLPEKVIKKYAMKKIAEDCFGDEVISNLKEEMRAAHIKCSGHHTAEVPEEADALLDDSALSRRKRSEGGASGRHFGPEKLEKIRARVTSVIGNITCMMKELKMLDQDNQVDLTSMKERLANMELDEGLEKDLAEGLDDCHQFASCLPSSMVNKSPAMMGFGQQMVFFKCLKMAKLEACMKKDFREDYLPMLVRDNLPADEDESFYTILANAVLDSKNVL